MDMSNSNHSRLLRNTLISFMLLIKSSPPSAAYMRLSLGSALVQIMAYRLFGARHYLNTAGLLLIGPLGTNFNEILIKIQNFPFTKMHRKISSAKCQPFSPVEDELTHTCGTGTHFSIDFSFKSANLIEKNVQPLIIRSHQIVKNVHHKSKSRVIV